MKQIERKTSSAKMAKIAEYATPANFERLNNSYSIEIDDTTTVYSSYLDMENNTLSVTVEFSTLSGFEAEPQTCVVDIREEVKGLQDKQSLLIDVPVQMTKAIVNAFNDEGVHFEGQNYNGNESLGTDFFELENALFKMELVPNNRNVERYYFKVFKLGLAKPQNEMGGM